MIKKLHYLIVLSLLSICLSACTYFPINSFTKYFFHKDKKVSDQQRVSGFLHDLYAARINLLVYNREKSIRYLQQALNKIAKMKPHEEVPDVMLEVSFISKGLKNFMYLALENRNMSKLNDVTNDLRAINQELISINIVNAVKPVITRDNATYVKNAISALNAINKDNPEYDFSIANKEIEKIYISWQIKPYEDNIVFTTNRYLTATELFLKQKNYGMAKECLKKAQKSFKNSFVISDFNKENPSFVSAYNNKISLLESRIEQKK